MKRVLNLLVAVALMVFVTASLATSNVVAQVNVLQPVCTDTNGNPLEGEARPKICNDDATTNTNDKNPIFGPSGIVTKGVQIFTIIVGIAAVIVIIISGLRFILSGGDSNAIAGARRSLIYAVIGLIVVALAQTIISFVLTRI